MGRCIINRGKKSENSNTSEEEEGEQFNVPWSSSYFPLALLTGLVKMVWKLAESK